MISPGIGLELNFEDKTKEHNGCIFFCQFYILFLAEDISFYFVWKIEGNEKINNLLCSVFGRNKMPGEAKM